MSATTTRRTPTASRSLWVLLAAGSVLVAVSGGVRATFGLYLDPVIESIDADRATYGLAIAIQSIVWGLGQPVAGAVADRFGTARVLAAGAVLYGAAMLAMGGASNALAVHATGGFLAGAGMAAASLSVILAALSRMADPQRRSQALGVATAFGTAGQIVLIPAAQWLIDADGWRLAVVVMGGLLVVSVVFTPVFRGNAADQTRPEEVSTEGLTPLRDDLRKARYSRGYQLLNLAFFVCGFHVTFIATHLKSYATDLG